MREFGERNASEEDPADATEIRKTLVRVVASPVFAASPKLASFLRYVVEATLEGRADRLKGYTIGVEALGRAEDFDPQIDPIVRVEAGRLRAALARYYAGPGRDDPVVIDLPRGGYVPKFRQRHFPVGLRKYSYSGRREVFRRTLRRWRLLAKLATVVAAVSLVGVAVLAALQWTARSGISEHAASLAEVEPAPLADSAFPLIFVEQFNAAVLSANSALAVARLRSKLRDALARFDEVEVAHDPDWARPNVPTPARPIPRSAYRISASADDQADGTLTLSVRLYDANEGTIVWARVIQGIRVNDVSLDNESDIVQRLAATIAQPYGVIYARELDKSSDGIGDPRSRCVIEAFEYYRTHDPTRRAHVRACVERITTAYPTFAAGQVVLAFQGLLDYFHNSSDIGVLETAMAAANRAIAFDPESARAHQVLMNVLHARGDPTTALLIGKKAVSLNPCDMIILTSYGIRLLWSGETDQAMTLLRRAAEYGPGQPQFVYFALFVGAYSRGDYVEASRYVSLLAGDNYAYGLAARAIAAMRSGQPEQARLTIQRLVQLKPAWRDNARREIERYGVPPVIAARMASDLAAAGLHASN